MMPAIANALRLLQRAVTQRGPVVFTNSFGVEGMVVHDLIARHRLPIDVVTLDTGRLPAETYALMERARERYGLPVRHLFPDPFALEEWVAGHGVNGFYRSVAARQQCCQIRKVEPLRRALAGKGAWVTGMRRRQSVRRAALAAEVWDREHGLWRINPLVDWEEGLVWDYVERFDVPYNVLHDRGYPSIGCAPCTRAVTQGEDPRAGRWWWEDETAGECGLHLAALAREPADA